MSQNTVDCGRTSLEFPQFQYDNSDGGQALWNTLFTCFERLTNDSSRRTLQLTSFGQSNVLTFAHNIGQAPSEMDVRIWETGLELTSNQIASSYSIEHDSTNALTLTRLASGAINGWLSVSAIRCSRPAGALSLRSTIEPSSPPSGQLDLFFDGVDIKAKTSDGTVVALTGNGIEAPAGSILATAASATPSGWLACDGTAVSRSTYARLFSAIGISHGQGDGATTFHLPDYRGRFLRGVDGTAGRDPDKATRTASNTGGNTGNAVGSVQGEETKTHNHTQNSHNHAQDSHNHTQNSHNHAQDSHNHTQNSHNHTQDAHNHAIDQLGGTIDNPSRALFPASITPQFSNYVQYLSSTESTVATNQATTATNNATTSTNQATTATNTATGGNETRPQNASVNYIIKY